MQEIKSGWKLVIFAQHNLFLSFGISIILLNDTYTFTMKLSFHI